MVVMHKDVETFSRCDIKSAGGWKYAEHESTDFLCVCYAFDEGPVNIWIPDLTALPLVPALKARVPDVGNIIVSNTPPEDYVAHIKSKGQVRAHSANFERKQTSGTAGRKYGLPPIAIEQMVCTAAKAAVNGVPRGLDEACNAVGVTGKMDGGRPVMLQLSRPRKPSKDNPDTRWTPTTAPEKFVTLYAYCIDDVKAERNLDNALPDLTEREQQVWQLDALINDRGIQVDLEATNNILAVVDEYKRFLADACELATRDWLGSPGFKPTQRDKIAEWVRANGYPALQDMQAETVREIVADPAVPENVKHVLRIYSTYNAKAITKYGAILKAVCDDGRVRGMFLYHGANTGRWSSVIVQLQNLFRPVIDDPETAVEAFSARNLDWIRALYDKDPMKVAASCVRSVLVAAKGKDLLFPDFAGIESRVNAWLFDEEWKLDMFRAYDAGTGPDSYCVAYGSAFNVDPRSIGKKDYRRQFGKVIDLFGGFEGGVGAFVKMANVYGIDLEEMTEQVYPMLPTKVIESAEWMWEHRGSGSGLPKKVYLACDGVKQLWRRDHPCIKQGWKDLKSAAEQAVQHPGKAYFIPNRKIGFAVVRYKNNCWLQMKLPSGRTLKYFNPSWKPEKREWRIDPKSGLEYEHITPGELRYWGIDTDTRQWKQVTSYGGHWCQNAVSGVSRDLLVPGMIGLENAGYPLVGSVHDEAIAEIPEDFGSFEEAGVLMCNLESWAAGLPVAVDGHRAKRYRK